MSSTLLSRSNVQARSRGFSFTEILFAVIILGIGFIMVAAIFPVAIQQGKLTTEETTAASVAREALGYLGQIGANTDSIANSSGGPLFPATGLTTGVAPYPGVVFSMRDPQPTGSTALDAPVSPANNTQITVSGRVADELWNRLKLSLIVPSDQRYAFVGLYRRNGNPKDRRTWAPYAQCWFIPVTARSRSIYNAGTLAAPGVDLVGTASNPSINLLSRLVKVQITDPTNRFLTPGTGGYVLYNYTAAVANYTPSALNENCYVIIANDQSTGRMNGHIYHVGLRRPDLDGAGYQAYDLAPNGDFAADAGADGLFGTNPSSGTDDDILAIGNTATVGASTTVATAAADAYVVGNDDSSGADPGTSQDISAFTTFIKVN